MEYEPKAGKILFLGHILLLDKPDMIKKIGDSWKKDKKLPEVLFERLLNSIFAKCNIKALALSQEVNLPPHIPLPQVRTGKIKEKKENDDVKKYIG